MQKVEKDEATINAEDVKQKRHLNMTKPLWLMVLLSLLLIVLIGIVALIYSQNRAVTQNQKTQLQVKTLQKELTVLESQISDANQHIISNKQAVVRLNTKTGMQNDDWVLAEVAYLVRLANFNLHFGHNISETQQLLKTADNRIAGLKDPRLLPIRKSLTENMATLAAIPQVDVEGILLKLNAQSNAINKLPVITTPEANDASQTHAAEAKIHQPGWKRNLERSWQAISKLIVVQYHNQPVSKLISSENRAYIDMHLQLLLSQAAWAVMHGKEILYKQNLQEAQIWIKNYYVGDSSKTQAMLATLSELVSINITPRYPEVINTLQVINSVSSKLHDENKINAL
ncbi:MAG: hypothetical protein CMF49_03210 [Legionellales bacterium]|nr:hypothetical protein [Legionellales bacterium]|tara:strand:- start:78 stop:1106 length:1029 start_codon:yes stop_codon:yes gene_type:complete